jgi:hypothetical protein
MGDLGSLFRFPAGSGAALALATQENLLRSGTADRLWPYFLAVHGHLTADRSEPALRAPRPPLWSATGWPHRAPRTRAAARSDVAIVLESTRAPDLRALTTMLDVFVGGGLRCLLLSSAGDRLACGLPARHRSIPVLDPWRLAADRVGERALDLEARLRLARSAADLLDHLPEAALVIAPARWALWQAARAETVWDVVGADVRCRTLVALSAYEVLGSVAARFAGEHGHRVHCLQDGVISSPAVCGPAAPSFAAYGPHSGRVVHRIDAGATAVRTRTVVTVGPLSEPPAALAPAPDRVLLVLDQSSRPIRAFFGMHDAVSRLAGVVRALLESRAATGLRGAVVRLHPDALHVGAWRDLAASFPGMVDLEGSDVPLPEHARRAALAVTLFSTAGVHVARMGLPTAFLTAGHWPRLADLEPFLDRCAFDFADAPARLAAALADSRSAAELAAASAAAAETYLGPASERGHRDALLSLVDRPDGL